MIFPRNATCCVLAIALLGAAQALAAELRVKEVASVTGVPIAQLEPMTIIFSDHRGDRLADKATGLIRFEDWQRTEPLRKDALGLFPNYSEPTLNVTVHGVTKPYKKKLHIYAAEARFVLPRPRSAINLSAFASLPFLEKIDPSITHRLIAASDAIPNLDPEAAYNRNPGRPWCEPNGHSICIQSHYGLEGKLPAGIRLANKLEEGGKKIPEFLEFQSELRALSPEDLGSIDVARLTQLDTPVLGALEQNTFYVNQIMAFGKLLAVFQAHPTDGDKTVVTTYMTLGIKSDVLERKKEFENVPVLRNLLPAQVLVGNSSFNTGRSISAGLPKYVRNSIQAIAGLMAAGN